MNKSMDSQLKMKIALTWCLGWGNQKQTPQNLELLQVTCEALKNKQTIPKAMEYLVATVEQLSQFAFPETVKQLQEITQNYPDLWNNEIGLVYGGATKIKQYVFNAAKLADIRGASAILDQINLIDIPAFFGEYEETRSITVEQWLDDYFPDLRQALIPELLIYYKGGNILAFCPSAFVNDLANAIERRYTEETITANSCAVGATFKPLEIVFGKLPDTIDDNLFWLEKYQQQKDNPLVKNYFRTNSEDNQNLTELEIFRNRKNFNELVTDLAIKFNQRRAGNDTENRPTRRYPVILETHPYLVRDDSEQASANVKIKPNLLPSEPVLSENLARKKLVGQLTKKRINDLPNWYQNNFDWLPNQVKSWIEDFENQFLAQNPDQKGSYYRNQSEIDTKVKEAQTLVEISDQCNGYVAYIYADGNNMGGYIQQQIKTPQEYQQFSNDIFEATKEAVYYALAEHLTPRKLSKLSESKEEEINNKKDDWIHPFEIIAIGGDDVLIIVPADKGLEIAHTIGVKFEELLLEKNPEKYQLKNNQPQSLNYQRYAPEKAKPSQCILSTSIGVLITSHNTPIYYADKLYNQLLKSAKKKAKQLKKDDNYHGGTVDFLSLKSVTMISSNLEEFRQEALTFDQPNSKNGVKLKLYAAPYTLHELEGIIKTVKALKASGFPRSQLYQLRSLLPQGQHTAILNYRYFTVRLETKNKHLLKAQFEETWCKAKTNNGNIAPWMYHFENEEHQTSKGYYETIWRDLVDLYPFIEVEIEQTAPV